MSRRRKATQRDIEADPKFSNLVLAKFINKVMFDGKKSLARTVVYTAIKKFADKIKAENQLEAFETALANAEPCVEVKSRRIGGATYQVPVEIPSARRRSLAMKWIIQYSRARVGKAMDEALAQELVDCFNNQGSTIKKKEDTHKMAEANKAFAHYKW